MKIYCLIRKTDIGIDGASTQVACYSSLEKAEKDMLYHYQRDINY